MKANFFQSLSRKSAQGPESTRILTMVRTVVSIDVNNSAETQPTPGLIHNRWHPDIPPVAVVTPGETFRVECFDCSGGQVHNNEDTGDIDNANLGRIHHLSGPIGIDGAQPGDVLEVEILDVQPLPGKEWGYTCILAERSFLSDKFPVTTKTIWDFDGIYASSRHIPGVKFPGIIHPGIVGTAPSRDLLQEWNKRERELIGRLGSYAAFPPNPDGALVGQLEGTELGEKVKLEGATTMPPRENGGNCDIKNLSRGSKVWLPVFVPGANLSLGDIHFSQGDGEIALCGGIEMYGGITLRTRLIKQGVQTMSLKMPMFMAGPVEPRFGKYLTFEGISVDEAGKQHYLDATLAFRQACLNCIEYFKKFGYTAEQVCTLISACPSEGRINSIVDAPNACCTVAMPTDIFDFDVFPTENLVSADRGQVAIGNLSKN